MPQKDFVHEAVKNALIKADWKITADPYMMEFEAEREGNKIVVEVKSFRGTSLMYEMHQAVGKYVNYRTILDYTHADRTLYLAFSRETLERLNLRSGLLLFFRDNGIRGIIVDIEAEEVTQWIDNWTIEK